MLYLVDIYISAPSGSVRSTPGHFLLQVDDFVSIAARKKIERFPVFPLPGYAVNERALKILGQVILAFMKPDPVRPCLGDLVTEPGFFFRRQRVGVVQLLPALGSVEIFYNQIGVFIVGQGSRGSLPYCFRFRFMRRAGQRVSVSSYL